MFAPVQGRLEFRSSTAKPRLDISFRGTCLLEVVAVFCLLFVGDFEFRDVTFDVEAVHFVVDQIEISSIRLKS